MIVSPAKDLSLAELVMQLETAVRAREHARASELEREILQRLATEAADNASMERRLRALMAELDQPAITLSLPDMERLEPGRFHIDRLNPPVGDVERPDLIPFDLDLGLERGGASDEDKGVDYPVWFATNRKPGDDGGFSGERHDKITHGRAVVHVPKAHRFGETGSSFWKRLVRGDDRLRLKGLDRLAADDFYADIRKVVHAARDAGDEPEALVFLHGFNVSFEDAAIRAAQIGYDLKVLGATAFFSWPSRGSVAAYPADEASIEASEAAITDFLVDFAANCAAKKVHVIAHSMGNRGLLRALQRIAANAETRGKVRFDQIFLAAPDVDRDLFLDLAHLYPQHAGRVTLYASARDLPVHLSSKLHDGARAGYFKPYTVVAGIDTVAVPDFDIDVLGHSYFAQAEALLHDIYDLMRHNEAPGKRQRIEAAHEDGLDFWRVKR
jgi:esterase/lipase superfamily enzyme